MARGQSRSQSELRSAGPDKGPNRKMDAEQVESFNTLVDKQAQDGWIGTDIPVRKLNVDERANLMAHLEEERERFLEDYEAVTDENGEQTEADVDTMLLALYNEENNHVADFFDGKSRYTEYGKLEKADQKVVASALKGANFRDLTGSDLNKVRMREWIASSVGKLQDAMPGITEREYKKQSDAGTIDLMKHDSYDKWMRSATGGKAFVKDTVAKVAKKSASLGLPDRE
jgi:hypothetical protein